MWSSWQSCLCYCVSVFVCLFVCVCVFVYDCQYTYASTIKFQWHSNALVDKLIVISLLVVIALIELQWPQLFGKLVNFPCSIHVITYGFCFNYWNIVIARPLEEAPAVFEINFPFREPLVIFMNIIEYLIFIHISTHRVFENVLNSSFWNVKCLSPATDWTDVTHYQNGISFICLIRLKFLNIFLELRNIIKRKGTFLVLINKQDNCVFVEFGCYSGNASTRIRVLDAILGRS